MFPYGYGYYGGPYYGYGYGPGPGPGPYYGPGYGSFGAPYGVTDYTDFYDYNSDLVLEDNEIQDLVSDTIAADPYIPQSDVNAINVSVNNGVVHLTGTVRNRRSKPLAYADAFWSRGVVDVVSDIIVREPGRAEGGQPGGGQMNGGRQGGGTQGTRGGGRSY
jgi:hypothetical protein